MNLTSALRTIASDVRGACHAFIEFLTGAKVEEPKAHTAPAAVTQEYTMGQKIRGKGTGAKEYTYGEFGGYHKGRLVLITEKGLRKNYMRFQVEAV